MILVINPGSSSLKYSLFSDKYELLKEANFNVEGVKLKNFRQATKIAIDQLSYYWGQINLIGIRVVYGGMKSLPEEVTAKTLSRIKKCARFAPHHNPKVVEIIETIRLLDKTIKIYAIYDNDFFSNLPDYVRHYPIDQKIAKKLNIFKNGFHGISHHYVTRIVDPAKKYRLISIHLGSGCSATAIDHGKVVDTSMGMTPYEGLVMQTRPGDIDLGAVMEVVKKFGLTESNKVFENKFGLAGLTDSSGNMKDILFSAGYKVSNTKDTKFNKVKNSKLALNIYINRIKKYIGAYSALMNGVDVVAFTGEIGYRSAVIRKLVTKDLDYLKIKKIIKIKPNEELEIINELKNAKFI